MLKNVIRIDRQDYPEPIKPPKLTNAQARALSPEEKRERRLAQQRWATWNQFMKDPEEARRRKREAEARRRQREPERVKAQKKAHLNRCPQEKIRHRTRCTIARCLRKGEAKKTTARILGCSIDDYRSYIEERWLTGMSWDNYGRDPGQWHIDHIKELAKFDLTDPQQFAAAFHYTNTRPLWAVDNYARARPRAWASSTPGAAKRKFDQAA